MRIQIKLAILFFVIIFMFSLNEVNATNITLSQIVEKFNAASFVQEANGEGLILQASVIANNKINIKVIIEQDETNTEYTLDGDILSSPQNLNEDNSSISMLLIDVIYQLHGHEEDEALNILEESDSEDFSLENNGLKITGTSSSSKFEINIQNINLLSTEPIVPNTQTTPTIPTTPEKPTTKTNSVEQNTTNSIESITPATSTISNKAIPYTGTEEVNLLIIVSIFTLLSIIGYFIYNKDKKFI